MKALIIVVLSVVILSAIYVYAKQAKFFDTNVITDNILARTSVRTYTNKKIEDSKIYAMAKSAMAAPSAMNKQPIEILVVTDRRKLDAIATLIPNASYTKQANLAFIICGDTKVSEVFWAQDCSAATENLLLTATSLGLGAVWCAVYPFEDKVKSIQEFFDLPKNIVPLNVIPVGYPAAKQPAKQKYSDKKIHINSWR